MVMEEQEGTSGLASESIPVPLVHDLQHETNGATVNQQEESTRSKPRYRKKALHALILKQMEFYFSDANLSKDRFLANLINVDTYVDLDVFLRCNKIRTLTEDKNRIAKALKNSTMLAMSEDGTKVRRITPIKLRDNSDARTIYVQGIPADTNHEWIINIFSRYDTVAYVSLPRYKSNRKLKGFAFIEFENIDGAEKCLKAFEEKDCILPSNTAPHELLSITTFSEDAPPPNELENDKLGSEPIAQKIKGSKRNAPIDEIIETKKPRLNSTDNEKIESEQNDDNEEDDDNVDKKKKKRKRNRRPRVEQPDIIDYGLRIMAKSNWKKLRNKYLQLQRSKMKQLKQHLGKTRWGAHDRRDKMEVDEPINQQQPDEIPIATPKFTFSEGLIIKIELDELCTNPKDFKNQFRGDTGVQYIDVKEGVNCAYIRCNNIETAGNFFKKYSDERMLNILQGDEEKQYWEKMTHDRDEKLGKRVRGKQRGRDKLLKKAEKELGKHIRFDEV